MQADPGEMAPLGSAERRAAVRAIAESRSGERGPLLEILRAVVAELGYVGTDDEAVIADVLNLSRAEVRGVVSFYSDLRTTPPAARTLRLCRAEACQAVGAEALFAESRKLVQANESVELEHVFCLGNCALGPSGMLDGRLYGRLDAGRVAALIGGDAR